MNVSAAMIRTPLWLLVFLFVGMNCLYAQPSQFGRDRRRKPQAVQEEPGDKANFSHLQGLPLSPIIGKIVWVDSSERFAVVWLDANIALNDRPLGTRDDKLHPQALLRFASQRTARAVGVVVERGRVAVNQEVVVPSASVLTSFQALPGLQEDPPPVEKAAPEKPAAEATKEPQQSASPN